MKVMTPVAVTEAAVIVVQSVELDSIYAIVYGNCLAHRREEKTMVLPLNHNSKTYCYNNTTCKYTNSIATPQVHGVIVLNCRPKYYQCSVSMCIISP